MPLAFFAVLGVVFPIYIYWKSPEGELKGYADFHDVEFSPAYERALESIQESLDQESFLKAFESREVLKSYAEDQKSWELIIDALSNNASSMAREQIHGISFDQGLFRETMFAQIQIVNDGELRLEEVKLTNPYIHSFQVRRSAGSEFRLAENDLIDLGNLAPLENVSLLVWFDRSYVDIDDLRLSHARGIGEWIEVLEVDSDSFLGFFVRHKLQIQITGTLFLLVLSVYLFLLSSIRT